MRTLFPTPCLMLVTDRHLCPSPALEEAVRRAAAAGVSVVQLREKDLPAGELVELGTRLTAAMAGLGLLVVNDRADVAAAIGADGMQLPENGLSVAAARRVLGADRLVGRSVHSVAGALAAEAAGADYLLFGNVYETGSHPGQAAAGLAALESVAKAVLVPVLAIGGITTVRVPEVLAAGAAGVAVISAILRAPDPGEATAELLAALRRKRAA